MEGEKHIEKSLINFKNDLRQFLAIIDFFRDDLAVDPLGLHKINDSDLALVAMLAAKEVIFDKTTKDSLKACIEFINSSELNNNEKGIRLKEYLEERLNSKTIIKESKPREDIYGPHDPPEIKTS